MPDPVIITCAITGSIHTPTMSPYLPVTPDEIVEQLLIRLIDGQVGLDIRLQLPIHSVIRPIVHAALSLAIE